MASSKVMVSSSPPNPDLPTHPSPSPLHSGANLDTDCSRAFGSMNMEDILSNIYSHSDSLGEGRGSDSGNKTVDEVWRDIMSGSSESGEPEMTLEVFLAKAGLVNPDRVRDTEGVTMVPPPPMMMSPAAGVSAVQFSPVLSLQNGMAMEGFGMDFGNGLVAVSGGGRGKRRAAAEEVPLDKATQQKQRRMIKNRESAARSRERKQAHTMELESLVVQLEEDNAALLKEEAELNKERYKQLMEKLIPVVEKRRPPRVMARVQSMNW